MTFSNWTRKPAPAAPTRTRVKSTQTCSCGYQAVAYADTAAQNRPQLAKLTTHKCPEPGSTFGPITNETVQE